MTYLQHTEFFLEDAGEEVEAFESASALSRRVEEKLGRQMGSIAVYADDGPRPWWQRFFFGVKRYTRYYFMLDWHGNCSVLIFQDDNGSEYRALPAAEDANLEFPRGANLPLEPKYYLRKERARLAVENFFQDDATRPSWLDYEFVE